MPARAEAIAFVINPSNWYESMYPTGVLWLSSYLEQHGYPQRHRGFKDRTEQCTACPAEQANR